MKDVLGRSLKKGDIVLFIIIPIRPLYGLTVANTTIMKVGEFVGIHNNSQYDIIIKDKLKRQRTYIINKNLVIRADEETKLYYKLGKRFYGKEWT